MREWREIKGTNGLYEVSSDGIVRTTGKYAKIGGGSYRYVKPKILTISKYPNGYSYVNICANNEKHSFLIHRLVAQAFIPNPDNLPQVNHKDEDITNNNVENLEWCTPKYNANYGTRNYRCREGNRRFFCPVVGTDKDGNRKYYESIGDASRDTGADVSAIIRVCKGKNIIAGGYRWEYMV